MKQNHQEAIFANKSIRREWKIGKFLYQGVTEKGFPFIVWATTNFGSILVGNTKDGKEPKSKLRNDASSGVLLNSYQQAKESADWMSREIVR